METFDLRDTIIPFSLLQISNFFKQMKPGETLEIITLEASILEDLQRILPELEYRAELSEQSGRNEPELRIRLTKNKQMKRKPQNLPKGGTSCQKLI